MSLHAYRNIGFEFTEQEATCQKWRVQFSGFDPALAVKNIGATQDGDYVCLTYAKQKFRLNTKNGVLEKEVGGAYQEQMSMNEALVVYHVLGDVQETPIFVGEWILQTQLDPVSYRSGNRTDPMLKAFAAEFMGKTAELEAKFKEYGGVPFDTNADLGYEFAPFPFAKMRLEFFDADEDFPATLNIYVDKGITSYMHFEAVGCMEADLLGKITDGE